MRELIKDREHLVRFAGLFVVGVVGFLIVRAVLVPEGFGEYGHFRPGAIDDNMHHAMHFGGQKACLDCHEDVGTVKASGKHAGVHCEACHWALAAHAADPASVVPERPDPKALCATCHAAKVGRPVAFPQVDIEEHSGGASCGDCHQPHSPGFE